MRFWLTYYDGIDSDKVGEYDTIRQALDDVEYWKFKNYIIYDTLESRTLINHKRDE